MKFVTLLKSLPKPLFFTLCGTIGGLLGALILGEPAWALLRPPRSKSPPPQLALTASARVQMYVGGSNSLTIQVARERVPVPVEIAIEAAPNGVTVAPVTLAPDQNETTLTVQTQSSVRSGVQRLTIRAQALIDGEVIFATAPVDLQIDPVPAAKVDVVFILDATGSMQPTIDGIKNGINDFAAGMISEKLDARFGLLAFRDRFEILPEPVSLRFRDGKFTTDAGEFRTQLAGIHAEGGGRSPEESVLDGMKEACNYPFRKDATRAFVVITDQGPRLPDKDTKSIQESIETLQRHQIHQLHFVAPLRVSKIYGEFRPLLAGRYFDFDAASRGQTGFRSLMPEFSRVIAQAAVSSRPMQSPEVTAAAPAAAIQGVQSGDTYDADATNRLLLAIAVWTATLSAGICLVLVAGQANYLRGQLPALPKLLAAFGGGAAAGMVGGAAGQLLYLLAPGSTVVAALLRIVSWAILGGLVGGGLSFVIPNLRRRHGLAGGAAGGALGAVGYLAASTLAGEIPGRLLGAATLGGCIGLFVALIEFAVRAAWLEVHLTPKEIVRVNLGPEPIRIGSDAKQCTIWARNAAPIALRYWIRESRVYCHDVATDHEAVVGESDRRLAGAVEVIVRTTSGAVEPQILPKPAGPPPLTRPAGPPPLRPIPPVAEVPVPLQAVTAPAARPLTAAPVAVA